MLPHDTPPYRSKKRWLGWQHSAACTAQIISSKFKVLVVSLVVQWTFDIVFCSWRLWMCDLFRVFFCGPQWDRLDWVSEQQWQFRRYSDPPKRRRHEGCTAPLAQMWGNETASCTQPTFSYISNLSCNERIFSHMHLVLVNDDDESKNLLCDGVSSEVVYFCLFVAGRDCSRVWWEQAWSRAWSHPRGPTVQRPLSLV